MSTLNTRSTLPLSGGNQVASVPPVTRGAELQTFESAWDSAARELAADSGLVSLAPPDGTSDNAPSALVRLALEVQSDLSHSLRPLDPKTLSMSVTQMRYHMAQRNIEKYQSETALNGFWGFSKSLRQAVDTIINSK